VKKIRKTLTSIDSVKNEFYKPITPYNPLEHIENRLLFFGIDFLTGKPIKLQKEDITHSLIVGPTRSGKGSIAGYNKIVESLRNGRGVIVIDPKQDDYLPQVIKEELERQIVNFPKDYGYSGFEETDTAEEFASKVITMLNLTEVRNNAGASYYRKNERVLLEKIIDIFFNCEEDVVSRHTPCRVVPASNLLEGQFNSRIVQN